MTAQRWIGQLGSEFVELAGRRGERPREAAAMTTTTNSSELSGRSVLIVGATGGLGTAIAVDLAARGALLTLVGRRQAALDALPVDGQRVVLDLRDPDACDRAVAAAVAHAGSLDVLVNAVGVVAFGAIEDLSVDTMEELFLTNTFVPIMLATAALRTMTAGGVIVNISGVIAEQNLPGMAAYGASKAAVRAFDQALAREARRKRIRVIDARPPHTETGLASRAVSGTAPTMPPGLEPSAVAAIIGAAIVGGPDDLGSTAFTAS